MMPEDKLTRTERRRLEALAQSIASRGMNTSSVSTEAILDRAKEFEKFIKESNIMDGGTP